MPTKPLKPCRHPGCPELVSSGYCNKHKKQDTRRYDRQRGTAAQRGYDYRWQKYTERYKQKHPLCCKCEARGDTKPTTDVDHIKPVSGPNDPLFWDPSNHQPLCHECHSAKTATENGGFGNGRRG